MPRNKNKTRKRKGKDLDEITDDLEPTKANHLLKQPIDLDLPGAGQFYCIECVRYFVDEENLKKHRRQKVHKQRVKALREKPYSQKEADAAAGLGTYCPPTKKTKTKETVLTE